MTLENIFDGPGRALIAVTKSASAQPHSLRALYVGTGGTVVARGENGDDVTFANVPNGATLLGSFTHILVASTASDFVGYV